MNNLNITVEQAGERLYIYWWNEVGYLRSHAETLIHYREWEKKWLDKGATIQFVCVLDT